MKTVLQRSQLYRHTSIYAPKAMCIIYFHGNYKRYHRDQYIYIAISLVPFVVSVERNKTEHKYLYTYIL